MKNLLTFLFLLCFLPLVFSNTDTLSNDKAILIEDINISIRVYLEGALMNNGNKISSSGRPLMRDNLRKSPFTNQNYLPVKDPYKYPMQNFDITSKFTYIMPGSSVGLDEIEDSIAVFSVTGENAIVDWVFIELRSEFDSTQIIASRGALLQSDGDVVDLDGVSLVKFPGVAENNFFIAVKHRSHLGVMSKKVASNQLVDFTSPNTLTFDLGIFDGINYTGLSQNYYVKTGYNALWAGDFNCDGLIKIDNPVDDFSVLLYDVVTYVNNPLGLASYHFVYGYYNSDYDMNSNAKFDNPFDDKNMVYAQVLFYPLNITFLSNFNLFIAQLPK